MSATAKANAKLLLKKYCITKPEELNLEKIANAEKIIVEEGRLDTHQGRIIYAENHGLIKIRQDIREASQKRFVLAHELGHYFNEGVNPLTGKKRSNYYGLRGCSHKDLNFYGGLKNHEAEANIFASELLMPKEWFLKFTGRTRINVKLLQDVTEYFGVSITAAALKYAETGAFPIAIIMSHKGEVKWSRINEYFPFKFIPQGYRVNSSSVAFDYFAGKEIDTDPDLVTPDAWFREDFEYGRKANVMMYEQNVVMGSYGAVLTILWES